ncbi:MAG: prenyltransferase, partial [Geobacter sp.]
MFLRSLFNYLELCRISNLPTVWVNTLAAGLLSGSPFHLNKFLFLLLSLSLMYCGGIVLNDFCDAAADAGTRPRRPLPSGRITPFRAGVLFTVSFVSALILLFIAAGGGIAIPALILLLLIVVYDLFHAFSVWTVFFMAGCRFMIYV